MEPVGGEFSALETRSLGDGWGLGPTRPDTHRTEPGLRSNARITSAEQRHRRDLVEHGAQDEMCHETARTVFDRQVSYAEEGIAVLHWTSNVYHAFVSNHSGLWDFFVLATTLLLLLWENCHVIMP